MAKMLYVVHLVRSKEYWGYKLLKSSETIIDYRYCQKLLPLKRTLK